MNIDNLNPNNELEQIKLLREKNTNFVFLFGRTTAGKTTLVTSLIYYLRKYADFGTLHFEGNSRGKETAGRLLQEFKSGRFPERTARNTFTELECNFIPNNDKKHLKPVKLCFLEVAGEDLTANATSEQINSDTGHKFSVFCYDQDSFNSLPVNLEIYFKAGVSMTFFLLASYDIRGQGEDDDSLIAAFLDYLYENFPTIHQAKIILVITRWDSSPTVSEITNFLANNLMETYRIIKGRKNAVTVFSVGRASGDQILEYNPEPADKIFRRLYQIIHGEEFFLKKKNSLDKLAGWFDI